MVGIYIHKNRLAKSNFRLSFICAYVLSFICNGEQIFVVFFVELCVLFSLCDGHEFPDGLLRSVIHVCDG